jgi:hypothetical protein
MVSHCEPESIALLALGEEDGLTAERDHVRGCAACQAEVDQLAAVVRTGKSITADDMPAVAPNDIWHGVVSELALAPAAPPMDELAARRARRASLPWIGVAAAAGLVLGGLGASQILQPTQNAEVLMATTLEPLPGNAVVGDAAIEQTAQGAVLSVHVPELPASDGYYEVWLLTPDVSNMISVGVLGGDNQGTFPLPPNLDLGEFSVVDISREKFDGDATHSSDSVVRGELPA